MTSGRTRRQVLGVIGATSASLAGCMNLSRFDGDASRAYDEAAIRTLAEATVPSSPDTFPVAIDASVYQRHIRRVDELLAAVPIPLTLPNEALASRLQDKYEQLTSTRKHLQKEEKSDEHDPQFRLHEWRELRGEAARLRWRYQAARGNISEDYIREQRRRLREDVSNFEQTWSYRGPRFGSALALHAYAEGLIRTARRGTVPWPRVPSDTRGFSEVVGIVAGKIEEGEAALADARLLRSRLLDSVTTHSYRDAFGAATVSLGQQLNDRDNGVVPHIETGAAAFDQDIAGTPAASALEEARGVTGEYDRTHLEELEGRHHYATGVLVAGRAIAAVEALSAVVDAIENGRYDDAWSTDDIHQLQSRATSSLESAWRQTPTELGVTVTQPALHAVQQCSRSLSDIPTTESQLNEIVGLYAFATAYADVVPESVGTVARTLEWANA